MPPQVIRICVLIRQLNLGGAQKQLLSLLDGIDKEAFQITVLTFYDHGHFCEDVKSRSDVRYICLEKKGRWDICGFPVRLVQTVRRENPHIIYSLLGMSNILAVLVNAFCPDIRTIWSLRSSKRDLKGYGRLERLTYFLERKLAVFTDRIIANSYSGKEFAAARGFPTGRITVVPNGVDTAVFRPNSAAGRKVRRELKVGEGDCLIGIVGRLDPIKDHTTFLQAAALLPEKDRPVRFACIGSGAPTYIAELKGLAEELDLADRVLWLGPRLDMPAVYCALDLLVSSSRTEGFSNAVVEAMASGVPCVVTDVGDSARLVEDTGKVVPAGNATALAQAIADLLKDLDEKTGIKDNCRRRVEENFAIRQMVKKTEAVFWDTC